MDSNGAGNRGQRLVVHERDVLLVSDATARVLTSFRRGERLAPAMDRRPTRWEIEAGPSRDPEDVIAAVVHRWLGLLAVHEHRNVVTVEVFDKDAAGPKGAFSRSDALDERQLVVAESDAVQKSLTAQAFVFGIE